MILIRILYLFWYKAHVISFKLCPFISDYVSVLMKETFQAFEKSADPLPSLLPLCSDFLHPNKEEAVLQFKSRFIPKETSV